MKQCCQVNILTYAYQWYGIWHYIHPVSDNLYSKDNAIIHSHGNIYLFSESVHLVNCYDLRSLYLCVHDFGLIRTIIKRLMNDRCNFGCLQFYMPRCTYLNPNIFRLHCWSIVYCNCSIAFLFSIIQALLICKHFTALPRYFKYVSKACG